MGKFSIKKNLKYWEGNDTISLIDQNLKKLEIDFISQYLKPGFEVLDMGCGDGITAVKIAPLVRSVVAVERSNHLKNIARGNAAKANVKNMIVQEGDILTFKCGKKFDAVITERVVINLPSWKLQRKAIENIYKYLKVGGLYIMVENTNDGHMSLNKMRKAVGLKPLKIHWHNLYFDYDVFSNFIKDKFELIERRGFSLYYFLTRVYTQMFASFTGFGKNAKIDKIFKVADPAAKKLYKLMEDQIFFKENDNILGAIQGFILRKKIEK